MAAFDSFRLPARLPGRSGGRRHLSRNFYLHDGADEDRALARRSNPAHNGAQRGGNRAPGQLRSFITLLAGLLMTVVDHVGFLSVGSWLWWAVQTVTTVGYGDHVPKNLGVKILASFIMLLGI